VICPLHSETQAYPSLASSGDVVETKGEEVNKGNKDAQIRSEEQLKNSIHYTTCNIHYRICIL